MRTGIKGRGDPPLRKKPAIFFRPGDWIFPPGMLNFGSFAADILEESGKMRQGWQFLSWRWWLVHFLGFALIYTAGRLTAGYFKG
jgi:hypothetical protein